jgi:hypothetical protein
VPFCASLKARKQKQAIKAKTRQRPMLETTLNLSDRLALVKVAEVFVTDQV